MIATFTIKYPATGSGIKRHANALDCDQMAHSTRIRRTTHSVNPSLNVSKPQSRMRAPNPRDFTVSVCLRASSPIAASLAKAGSRGPVAARYTAKRMKVAHKSATTNGKVCGSNGDPRGRQYGMLRTYGVNVTLVSAILALGSGHT